MSAKKSEIDFAKEIIEYVEKYSGVTAKYCGEIIRKGFAVSKCRKEEAFIILEKNFTVESLIDFLEYHRFDLVVKGLQEIYVPHVGVWKNGRDIVLLKVWVYYNEEQAHDTAYHFNQEYIYDLENRRMIEAKRKKKKAPIVSKYCIVPDGYKKDGVVWILKDYGEDLVENQGKTLKEAQKLVNEASQDERRIKALAQWGYGFL